MLSSILRIIEGTQMGDIEKVLNYAKRILPPEELEDAELCIRERFNPNAGKAVMDGDLIELTDREHILIEILMSEIRYNRISTSTTNRDAFQIIKEKYKELINNHNNNVSTRI